MQPCKMDFHDKTYNCAMQKTHVIVVGAGPAGLMAAGQAALQGAEPLLLEKMEQCGLKLRLTGKGRCNLTNTAHLEDFLKHFGAQGQFLRQPFARFFSSELLDFMQSIGVPTQTERGGRVFPLSEDAHAVTEKLTGWIAAQGVQLRTSCCVQSIEVNDRRVSGVVTSERDFLPASAVILATGGASFSHTGSTGAGYRMAAALGHTIQTLRPALVPLRTAGSLCPSLQGLTLRNVRVDFYLDGKLAFQDFGELLFTHFGLSGPLILSRSGTVVDALQSGRTVHVSIDLKPALDEEKLDARLLREIDAHGKQHLRALLKSLLPQKMIAPLAELCGLPLDTICHQITAGQRACLRRTMKDLRLEISGHLPLEEAMLTAGGVALKEVDSRSMQSRLVPGLFFAGEILDLAADTGGFNLQAAFSTGWLAGISAARFALSNHPEE